MLPAIAVILWCNLLAVLTNGYLKVISIEAPAKQATARLILGATAVITLMPATWQTAEVVNEGIKAIALIEKVEETYERPSWSKGLSTTRLSGAKPNQNLPCYGGQLPIKHGSP